MGGQNHQPTKTRITAASAWLSRQVGDGFAAVLLANSHLEDAIMVGMNRLHIEDLTEGLSGSAEDHLRYTLQQLAASQQSLKRISVGFQRLQDTAALEAYEGNPLASTIAELNLRARFEGVLIQPTANERVWTDLESRIQSDNILETLKWEAKQFEQLETPTSNLIATIESCLAIAKSEGGYSVAMAIENNEVPLRQYYAQVFSLWNTLHAMFLYSALMMTELFYRLNAFPSLLDFDPESTGVKAA